MKKSLVMICFFLLLATSACTSIHYVNDGQEVEKSKRVVYFFFGAAPLNNNNIKSGPQYVEKYTFLDYLFTGLTLGIIATRTVEKQ